MLQFMGTISEIVEVVRRVRTIITIAIVLFALMLVSSCVVSIALIIQCSINIQQSKQQMERLHERREYIRDSLQVERIKRIEEVKREIGEYHKRKGYDLYMLDTLGDGMKGKYNANK